MKRLKVSRFLQDPAYCSVGSCAVISSFYNPEMDYEFVKKEADKMTSTISDEGLHSGQICYLLNKLGFYKVTLVSSVFECFDYSWQKLGKKRMLEELENAVKTKKDPDQKIQTKEIYKWYKQKEFDNNIIITYDFGKYIRKHLNKKKPLILTFNWNMFFKFPKEKEDGKSCPINGVSEIHAVVINGYDDKGVWVCDSHHQYYKYKRKKYRRGFYKISWENLMTTMGEGDVIIPEEYMGY